MLVFSIDMETAKSGNYNIMGILLSKFIALLIFFILKSARHSALFGRFRRNWAVIYVLPIATILVIFAEYYSMWYYPDNNFLKTIALVSMISLIFSNLFIFRLVDGLYEAVVNENKLMVAGELVKKQAEQYSLILSNHQQILKIRHDYKNFLIGILSELSQSNYEDIQNKLQIELKELSSTYRDVVSGNSIIDTIVNYKISSAKEKGIEIDYSYKGLANICVSGIDLSILLGNALDNAIEATEKLSNPDQKKISLFIILRGSKVIISIKNRVEREIDIQNLRTDKKDTVLHGYGILNMKTIAKKYNGDVLFTCNDFIFQTTIMIDNKNDE